jgi:eukaryotic-like serine/threonine-protein kinase
MTRLFFLGLVVALAADLPVSAQPEDLPKKFTNSLGMEFTRVPKGKSWLGGDGGGLGDGKEGKKEVNIAQHFYLGTYDVTQEEWQKVMGKNPSHFSRDGKGADAVKDIADADLKRFPVENVSWEDAKEFVKLLNAKVKKERKEAGWEYRLPTEEEWEYACRGGPMLNKAESAFDFYFEKPGTTLSKEQANFAQSKLDRTCKVGSYRPNRLGLYDMAGNVWQWCEEHFDSKKSPDRVMRGGSWADGGGSCTAWSRLGISPSARHLNVGLRLARVPSIGR